MFTKATKYVLAILSILALFGCANIGTNTVPVKTINTEETTQYADSDKISEIAANYVEPQAPAVKPVRVERSVEIYDALTAALVMGDNLQYSDTLDKLQSQYIPDEKSLTCLALAMYHEARGEGDRGMIAVGYVVVNRTKDSRFPDTVCGVTGQGKKMKNGKYYPKQCQFSYMCDGLSDVPKNQTMYDHAKDLAYKVLKNKVFNPVSNSLYFHAIGSKTVWFYKRVTLKRLGRHIFYT